MFLKTLQNATLYSIQHICTFPSDVSRKAEDAYPTGRPGPRSHFLVESQLLIWCCYFVCIILVTLCSLLSDFSWTLIKTELVVQMYLVFTRLYDYFISSYTDWNAICNV